MPPDKPKPGGCWSRSSRPIRGVCISFSIPFLEVSPLEGESNFCGSLASEGGPPPASSHRSGSYLRLALLAARLVMAGIFLYASIDKIAHPAAFAKDIYNYQILPDALINLTALLLPWLE